MHSCNARPSRIPQIRANLRIRECRSRFEATGARIRFSTPGSGETPGPFVSAPSAGRSSVKPGPSGAAHSTRRARVQRGPRQPRVEPLDVGRRTRHVAEQAVLRTEPQLPVDQHVHRREVRSETVRALDTLGQGHQATSRHCPLVGVVRVLDGRQRHRLDRGHGQDEPRVPGGACE